MSATQGVTYVPMNGRGVYIDASLWVLEGLAAIFLSLRLYCKIFRRNGLWWDDGFLIASWTFLLASVAATTVNARLGFGQHFAQVPLQNLELLSILSIISGFFSILSAVTSKTSFALTLLRLSDGWLKRVVQGIIITTNLLLPVSAVFLFAACNPPAKAWKPYLPGSCWPGKVTVIYGLVVGSYSAICDMTLALLPWGILMRFKMYRREKVGVAIAMSMGFFAGAIAIVKCTMLPLLANADFTYVGAPFVIWGAAESAVSIMAASIPALRALVKEVRAPRARQRQISSLVISPPKPITDTNGTTLTTFIDINVNGSGSGGKDAAVVLHSYSGEGRDLERNMPAPLPIPQLPTSDSGESNRRDDSSDKGILARAGPG